MEQKRVLWIVAAVGLFLTVTLGTALIVYRPAKNQTPVLNPQLSSSTWTRESPAPETTQPVVPAPAEVPETPAQPAAAVPAGDNPTQVTNLTVISANTNVISDGTKTIDLSALTQEKPSEQPPAAQAQPVQPVAAVATAEITVKTVTEPVTTTPAPATTKATKAAAAAVKTATTKIPDQFWVQAASFTQKINAEEARDALAAEKIPGEVFTWKDDKGVVYYRLRVGPYTTKSEADFWLSRIKEIGAFASTSSYVVNSSEKAAN
ncbi:MAG: SPOR domain-containing protein [Treponema sp.]|nr:SPOR domain-containing protein [Candidatus Treponema caballi]